MALPMASARAALVVCSSQSSDIPAVIVTADAAPCAARAATSPAYVLAAPKPSAEHASASSEAASGRRGPWRSLSTPASGLHRICTTGLAAKSAPIAVVL